MPTSEQVNPPDGITIGPVEETIEHRAEKVPTGVQNISKTVQKYSGPRKMLKMGNHLVKESKLRTQTCDAKSGRKVIPPLRKGLGSSAKRHEKLFREFAKYMEWIHLLFWFAGTTAAEKIQLKNHTDHANLTSRKLSPYMLPFDSAFTAVGHLRNHRTFPARADGHQCLSAEPALRSVAERGFRGRSAYLIRHDPELGMTEFWFKF
ncbi:hypothetical protein B0H17DRAFT_1142749 [Mycena rosella]|uniref:Uncharacterized protein n=1 Tax=Mycena rosella TaxID=1033263 RepID=A0AAD7G7M2_MYCRO|nr:hypothetical protein B0H17DRAFT_1142749 [Mycena rosella]